MREQPELSATEPSVVPDPSFDRYARLVRRALGVPIALVSLVEATRQVFPGASGLPASVDAERQTPLTHSFCQYVVKDAAPLVISDARLDERLADNLAIPDLGVIAYAGWPLTNEAGLVIGSLCAIDVRPREWTENDLAYLEDLAAACSAELAERERRDAANAMSHRANILLLLSEGLADTRTMSDVSAAVHRVALDGLGCSHAGIWLLDAGPSLRYVEHPTVPWPQALQRSGLSVDRENPIGAAIVEGHGLFLTDDDGRSWAVLPLSSGPDMLGAVALVWRGDREFTDDDRVTIAALAAYSAQAVQRAQLLDERVDAAAVLQRAMLTELPQPDHLELVARYRTATGVDQVGGDWYDAVVMPSGHTSLMIGDVTGHDIRAAATMGQLRSMLRAIAWAIDDDPSANVTRLGRALRDLRVRGSATLVYARIEQSAADAAAGVRTLRWTNAGHLPPLLIELDGTARFLDDGAKADPLIGVTPRRPRRNQVVKIPDRSTLLLFTDGLIERRDEDLDNGLEQLRAVAARHNPRPLPVMVDAVLDDLLGHRVDDDVAVLAVRFHPEPHR